MSQSSKVSYHIRDGVAFFEYIGEENYETQAAAHTKLAADPAFYPEIPKLLDVRRVTNFAGPKELMRIRDLVAELHRGAKGVRRIASVSEDLMVEKISRLYQDILETGPEAGRVEHRFFSSMDKAEAWLREGLKKQR